MSDGAGVTVVPSYMFEKLFAFRQKNIYTESQRFIPVLHSVIGVLRYTDMT